MVVRARDFAQAKGFIAPPGYSRHRPETTLLYQLVAEHYPGFRDRRAAEERPLHAGIAAKASQRDKLEHLARYVSRPPVATDRRHSLTWAQRLKRVFAIDIEVCRRCGGKLRVIASIEEPATIERILEHLGRDGRVLLCGWFAAGHAGIFRRTGEDSCARQTSGGFGSGTMAASINPCERLSARPDGLRC